MKNTIEFRQINRKPRLRVIEGTGPSIDTSPNCYGTAEYCYVVPCKKEDGTTHVLAEMVHYPSSEHSEAICDDTRHPDGWYLWLWDLNIPEKENVYIPEGDEEITEKDADGLKAYHTTISDRILLADDFTYGDESLSQAMKVLQTKLSELTRQ